MTVIDDYIDQTDGRRRELLIQMCDLIRTLVPDASEKIGYGIPTWTLNGNMVHIAGFKEHVSIFPGADGVAAFEDELGGYVHSKGTIQFRLEDELPIELITRIVQFREAQQRAKAKKPRNSTPSADA
ncbi:MAG: DUF1801 domain-containing protein [Propionibacteriaceae bacterium]|nr:DUF1801 domain-containing protein [Micropruina sp.]HBX82475.1 hypothetical protein [Propionibacteriaceae bacterium]HBY23483.1 hypothetical protein [Propionibacteriaceae bacterium]